MPTYLPCGLSGISTYLPCGLSGISTYLPCGPSGIITVTQRLNLKPSAEASAAPKEMALPERTVVDPLQALQVTSRPHTMLLFPARRGSNF